MFYCSISKQSQPIRRFWPKEWHGHQLQRTALVYFSTFKPINITPHSVMQHNWVPMLCDTASSSNEPCLCICPVSNVLAVCLWFLASLLVTNTQQLHTGWHSFGSRQEAITDTRPGAGNGSRLFELSPWMWCYGRGQPRKWLKLRPWGGSWLASAGSRQLKPWRGAWSSVGLISMSASASVRQGRGPQMDIETWCYIKCYITCYIT